MISQSFAHHRLFGGRVFRLRLLFPFLFFGLGALATTGQSAFTLQTRSGYYGDPYLSTNAAGQISLVMNPEVFTTNSDYQARVAALAAQDHADPQNPWAFLANAGKEAVQARQAVGRLFGVAGTQTAMPAAQGTSAGARPVSVDDDDFRQRAIQFSYVIQHWLLFTLVVLFIGRRVWRYFRAPGDDDEFANHLATLAVAHRWIFPVYMSLLTAVAVAEFLQVGNLFFSLSLLMLASAIRGYYCEGDFADFPRAQKVHLALSLLLVWLGWSAGFDNYLADIHTWVIGHGLRNGILAWLLLACFIRAFKGVINGSDLAGQWQSLSALAVAFALVGLTGGLVGALVWNRLGWRDSVWHGFVAGGVFSWLLLASALFASRNPVFMQVFGGAVIDLFLPRFFGQKVLGKRHLPSLLLLQHWRDHGDIDKAWQTARAHLFKEPRALPIWLFALETAVLYRRQPEDALQILSRLCATEDFAFDHRTVAIAKMEEWMRTAGFDFDRARFNPERPPLEPTALADKVEQKCRAGQPNEAAAMLRAVLENDSLNEAAFIQLVRIYCQDLKNRRGAERLIAEAADTFSPNLLGYLERSLDEWVRMPVRSTVKPKGLLSWLFPPAPPKPRPAKLSITAPPITQKPRPAEAGPADPLESYLERVRQSHGKPRDTSGIFDQAEKLLAERRLGSAVELIKQQAEAAPADFDLWLRFAEAHGHHCADPAAAEKVVRQMERSGHFKKSQMKKAHNRLKKWWKNHATNENHW